MILPEAAVIVIRDFEGRILTVTRRNSDLFGLPGGKLDAGELPEEAAIREAKEETGIEVKSASYLFSKTDGEFITHCYHADTWRGTSYEVEPGIVPDWKEPSEIYGTGSAFPEYNRSVVHQLPKLNPFSGNT